ncbi:MAG: HNH endonuclease [Gammaproteobacteria bacterium]|nr:HNH endonuclease [Gammaproteobacteria bacterium]
MDADPKRNPTVVNGVAQPLVGTTGKPKAIPMYETERDGIATREFKGKTYFLQKDQDGFPEFTIYETYLDDSHINSGDEKAHFAATNGRLGQLLKQDSTLKKTLDLNDEQVEFFMSDPSKRSSPPDLTWHHHQRTGKVQLVNKDLHARYNHIGGMEIWGGGRNV